MSGTFEGAGSSTTADRGQRPAGRMRRFAVTAGVMMMLAGGVVAFGSAGTAYAIPTTGFTCPGADNASFPVGNTDTTSDPIFCSYPAFPGEDPNDFFCTYSASTGVLVTDNDAGFCPATAAGSAPVLATPSITTTQQPASATVGSSIADKATVSAGASPTGTVTFKLYDNSGGSGTPLFTDTETLSGGTATSAGYTTTATGTDYWVATYNGDTNNNGVTSTTNAEPVTITSAPVTCPSEDDAGFAVGDTDTTSDPIFCSYPAVPGEDPNDFYCTYDATTAALVTDNDAGLCPATANGGTPGPVTPSINTAQQPATATVGSSIADKATVSGGKSPTGTVTFKLYNNATASGTALFTDTETLSGGTATSAGDTTTSTGTDYWVATYNGDTNNNSVTSTANAEPVTVTGATPSITTTQQPASATAGSSIADKATVSGGSSPTGTVTFKLYNNATASGTPLFTDTETLSSGHATSAGYTTTASGTDYWVATYNGDANNSSVTSAANAEPVTITKATTSLRALPQLILFRPLAGVGSNVVAAVLTSGGNPVGGQSVSFSNGATHLCTATTNAAGLARCTISGSSESLVLRTNRYTATFAGNTSYVGSSNTTPTVSFF